MKWILAILLFVSGAAIGQSDDTDKYIWYKFQYGSRMPRFWADSVLKAAGLVKFTGLAASADTTTYKPLGINSSGNVVKFGTWPGSGGGTPGGSNTQIQYNNSGSFGAEAAFTYNATTNKLTTDSVRFLKGIADSIMMGSFEPDLIDSATFFGTSITAGTNALPVGTNRYSAIVSGGLRVNEINKGLGGYLLQKSPGWPLTNTFKDVYATMIQPKTPTSRYIFFAWGENDADAEESYGGLFGVDTVYFKRDYLIAIQYAISVGWALGDIRIISPFWQLTSRTALSFQQKYFDAAKNFADSMGIQFIDVFTQGKNYGSLILDDDIHPSNYGHALAAYAILKEVNQPLQAKSGENLINAGTTLLNNVKFFGKDTATAGHSLGGINSDGSLVRVPAERYPLIDNTNVPVQPGNISIKGNLNAGKGLRASGQNSFGTGAGFQIEYDGTHGYLTPFSWPATSGNIFMPFSRLVVGSSSPTSPFSHLYVVGSGFARGLYSSGNGNIAYNSNDNQTTLNMLVSGDSVGHIITYGYNGGSPNYYRTAINGTTTTQPVVIGTLADNGSGAMLQVNGHATVTDDAYDATDWNGNIEVPTKNAIRDKIESMGSSGITSINSQTGPAITLAGGIGTYTSAPSANTIAYNVDPTSDIFTRTVDAIMTTAGNTGTGETDLYSKTVAGGTLNTDKQTLNFEADGEFNDNTATATLKLYFGGNVTLNTGAINISTANTAWRLRGYIIRTSSTTAHVTYELHCPGLATPVFLGYNNLTSLDFTVGNIIKVTAQAGGAGGGTDDITAHSWQVLYKPQPQ